jgi:hypothetical protein
MLSCAGIARILPKTPLIEFARSERQTFMDSGGNATVRVSAGASFRGFVHSFSPRDRSLVGNYLFAGSTSVLYQGQSI